MKLILANDNGTVIEQWNVEEDFGDLTKRLPAATFTQEVILAMDRHRLQQRGEHNPPIEDAKSL